MGRTGRRVWQAGTALVLGAAALAACGSVPNPVASISHLTTRAAVGRSFSALLQQQGIEVSLSLPVAPDDVDTIDRESGGHGISAAERATVDALIRSSLSLAIRTTDGSSIESLQGRSTIGGAPHSTFDVALHVGQAAPVELRSVGGALYGRVDLRALVTDFGQPPSAADHAQASIAAGDAEVPGLGALAQGRWVSADPSSLLQGGAGQQLSKQLGSLGGTGRAVLHQLGAALRDHADVANAGTHDGRTEYRITVHAQAAVQELASAWARSLAGTPAATFGQLLQSAPAKIPPSQVVVVTEWVQHDRAEELDLDLAQFDHRLTVPLPLRVVLSVPGPVSAPAGATALDLSHLLQSLGGLHLPGGLGGGPADPGAADPSASAQ